MRFTISATDGREVISFQRTTSAAALGRARELERQGMDQVRITDLAGKECTTDEFEDAHIKVHR